MISSRWISSPQLVGIHAIAQSGGWPAAVLIAGYRYAYSGAKETRRLLGWAKLAVLVATCRKIKVLSMYLRIYGRADTDGRDAPHARNARLETTRPGRPGPETRLPEAGCAGRAAHVRHWLPDGCSLYVGATPGKASSIHVRPAQGSVGSVGVRR